MTNKKHARELEAQAMMYPQGEVFDALMAGAAALREMTDMRACFPVMRAFCDAALAFADAKASIEAQSNEYKRTLAALQAARKGDKSFGLFIGEIKAEALEAVAEKVGNAYASRVIRAEAARLRAGDGGDGGMA